MAQYSPSTKRSTMHACIGDIQGGSTRARNILQHNLQWMQHERFAKTFLGEDGGKERLTRMWQHLLEMDRKVEESGKPVGYSHIE